MNPTPLNEKAESLAMKENGNCESNEGSKDKMINQLLEKNSVLEDRVTALEKDRDAQAKELRILCEKLELLENDKNSKISRNSSPKSRRNSKVKDDSAFNVNATSFVPRNPSQKVQSNPHQYQQHQQRQNQQPMNHMAKMMDNMSLNGAGGPMNSMPFGPPSMMGPPMMMQSGPIMPHPLRNFLQTHAIVVVDTETTGLYNYDKIIQIAAEELDHNLQPTSNQFNQFINPGRKLSKEIVELTGISDEQLETAPLISQVMSKFRAYLSNIYGRTGRRIVLVGHNIISFDARFLFNALNRDLKLSRKDSLTWMKDTGVTTLIDSLLLIRAHRKAHPDKCHIDIKNSPNNKQGVIYESLFGVSAPDAHNALGDVSALSRIIAHSGMQELLSESLKGSAYGGESVGASSMKSIDETWKGWDKRASEKDAQKSSTRHSSSSNSPRKPQQVSIASLVRNKS
eukprot:TRINITY_DN3374_c0_g1_i1.p1 TRINITY_DN3374_c0_g1~~TRINITY_DN3374_c0_g1_i1.p1  ORF type:complete len:455 (+),score=149.98 TRINITY_DN3374_c0_g1_i1:45-1409(+)